MMSLHVEPPQEVPEDTARVARAAFAKGNRYLRLRDTLGTIFSDASFAALFATRGRPAESPWRLALVTVWQFAEGLSDRQAAEAVRARIDWKYALGLPLADDGFQFSVLSAFRERLLTGGAERQLLATLLALCQSDGYLRAGGQQRTDATHVLGVLRTLNRLELVAETLRAALNALAVAAPDWLLAHSAPAWSERYARRVEEYRLPKGKAARASYADQVGEDGLLLLAAVAEAAPALRQLPAVELLRRLWIQQYVVTAGRVRLRTLEELPPSSLQLSSPYEPEARYATKRQTHWTGYKVHLTETCAAPQQPQLITQVSTTPAPRADVEQLATIQQGLATATLLPAQQLVDTGYISGQTLVQSREQHQIELLGPMYADHQWQAKAGAGFALAQFAIDWAGQLVTCPQGQQSRGWHAYTDRARGPLIGVRFAAAACTPCPVRAQCTRRAKEPRTLTLRPQTAHAAIAAARCEQQAPTFRERYALRAGIEGTLSQAVRAYGLREARYRGLAKTQLQELATASAINLSRLDAFCCELPRARTRRSRYAALTAGPA